MEVSDDLGLGLFALTLVILGVPISKQMYNSNIFEDLIFLLTCSVHFVCP